MPKSIDVDGFVQSRQNEIIQLVNTALNRAGDVVKQKVEAGEVKPTIQDVLPLMLYEILVANTVSTLRLVAEMLEDSDTGNKN